MTIQTGILEHKTIDDMHAKLIATMMLSFIHQLVQDFVCIC